MKALFEYPVGKVLDGREGGGGGKRSNARLLKTTSYHDDDDSSVCYWPIPDCRSAIRFLIGTFSGAGEHSLSLCDL